MALTLHPVPGKAKSRMICEAFAAGAPRDATGHVFYGVTEGNLAAWRKVQDRGLPYWFIDGSYFDTSRGTHFRVTLNRIQHTGMSFDTTGERFEALDVVVAPVRAVLPGPQVMVVHQSDLFMDVIVRNPHWVAQTLARWSELGMSTLRHRPWRSDKGALSQTLQQAFADTDLVITHSSAAAVEAVLAGLQVQVSHQSAAHAIASGDEWDRRQWAGVLADNQFTTNEMKDGTAWHMLARN